MNNMNNNQSPNVRLKAVVEHNGSAEFMDILMSSQFNHELVTEQLDGLPFSSSDEILEAISTGVVRHLIHKTTESAPWEYIFGQLITFLLASNDTLNHDDNTALLLLINVDEEADEIASHLITRLVDSEELHSDTLYPDVSSLKLMHDHLFNK